MKNLYTGNLFPSVAFCFRMRYYGDMKKFMFIAVMFLFVATPALAKLSDDCISNQCIKNADFLEKKYDEQLKNYEKEMKKKIVTKNKKFECVQQGFTLSCKNITKATTTVRFSDFDVATTSIPLSPSVNWNLALWSARYRASEIVEKAGGCWFIFCRPATYDEKIQALKEVIK